MKAFLKKHAKSISKILLMLLALAALSVIAMFVLKAIGIIYFEDGINLNTELFDSFTSSWYGWVIIILLQILITSALCFIPGTSMAFIMLIHVLYANVWKSFIIAFLGVMLSSVMMYVIGRIGGYRVCKRILGDKDCEKASDLLNNKGAVFFPIMMMFPMFPDDALVMIAGTLKMSLKWFIPSIIIGRGIGIATIIFGLGNVPYEKFTTPWHWIAFILICIVLIVAVFFLANRFNKFLERRRNGVNKEEKET